MGHRSELKKWRGVDRGESSLLENDVSHFFLVRWRVLEGDVRHQGQVLNRRDNKFHSRRKPPPGRDCSSNLGDWKGAMYELALEGLAPCN